MLGSLARKFIDEVVGECDMTDMTKPAKRAATLNKILAGLWDQPHAHAGVHVD